MKYTWGTFLDYVYPRKCVFCDEMIHQQSIGICKQCQKEMELLPFSSKPRCVKCGKPLEEETAYCSDCLRTPKSFVRGFPLYSYREQVKESLVRLKYQNYRTYGETYGNLLAYIYQTEWKKLSISACTAVPIHPKKYRARRYNQAEEIAKAFSIQTKIPYVADYFKRVVNTAPQKELTDKQRFMNLSQAFVVNDAATMQVLNAPINRLLIIDDIYTTGATLENLSRIAMQAGVNEVYVAYVAIGSGY